MIRATNRLLSDFDATINYLHGYIHSIHRAQSRQAAGVIADKNKTRSQDRNRNPDKLDMSKKKHRN
jgi:hypothetical protein